MKTKLECSKCPNNQISISGGFVFDGRTSKLGLDDA
jgi:hypothetical protein